MNEHFEVKVKYEKINERGAVKKVTESYLIDAMSFTEAEANSIKELEPYLGGEFIITNMARANYSEIFPNVDGDRWFKCKIEYVTIDEEKGTEKKKPTYILVQANKVADANEKLIEAMSAYLGDYNIKSVAESSILDVFVYQP